MTMIYPEDKARMRVTIATAIAAGMVANPFAIEEIWEVAKETSADHADIMNTIAVQSIVEMTLAVTDALLAELEKPK